MTSTPPPQPLPPQQPSRPILPVLRQLRDLAAYALVAAPAVWLFVAIIRLVPSGVGQDFLTRVQNSFYSYVNVEIILLPLAAVLLSTLVEPRHRHARLITVVALVEYAVAGFFGVVFGFLIGIVKIAGFSIRVAFEELLVRAAWLAVFAVAAYAVYLVWRTLFHTPRPQQQPGVYGQPQQPWGQQPPYGQPQPGQPQAWGQPAWGQPTSQQPTVQQGFAPQAPPASAPPAYPGPAMTGPGAPGPGTPGPGTPGPGTPGPGTPGPGTPGPGMPPGPFVPAPGNPHSAQPAYAPPPMHQVPPVHSAPPVPSAPPAPPGQHQSPGGPADPTQTLPARGDDEDRTRIVGEEPPRG
ncbi:hypothetical protein [Actinoplanes sp. NPDC049681]|uniref:hypothetical protein n=1 Tax=Actinoplanes sp. NPDC049681 TaxID=3363905 RepID=UPI0037A0BFFE